MKYTPEHPFEITEDSKLVYNLKHHSFKKGKELFENDIAISIQSRTLDEEDRKKIAEIIRDALNNYFQR